MGVVDLNKVRHLPPPLCLPLTCNIGPIYPTQPPRLARMPSLPDATHERRFLPGAHARQEAPNEPGAPRRAGHEGRRAAGRAEAVERAAQGVSEDRAPGVPRDQGAGPRDGQGGHDGADTPAADQGRRRPAQAVHERLGTEEGTPEQVVSVPHRAC